MQILSLAAGIHSNQPADEADLALEERNLVLLVLECLAAGERARELVDPACAGDRLAPFRAFGIDAGAAQVLDGTFLYARNSSRPTAWIGE